MLWFFSSSAVNYSSHDVLLRLEFREDNRKANTMKCQSQKKSKSPHVDFHITMTEQLEVNIRKQSDAKCTQC